MPTSILIAEDDDDIRTDLSEMLVLRGYAIASVANGAEALEQLHRAEAPCLIVLDLMMPVMDGWQFRAEMLKEPSLSKIPIVVMSGAVGVQTAARSLGAVGYFTKPFKLQSLLDLIERVCPVENEA